MWSEENPGLNIRDWLYVKDNCRAIWLTSQNGEEGNVYNIPGENEITNIDITKILLSYFGYEEDMIEKVPHREAHDFRYSILGHKIKRIGFKHNCLELKEELLRIVNWYKENENWWRPLKNYSPQNILVNSNFGWR